MFPFSLQEMAKEASVCHPEMMDSEDMLFMLYTSGSTGQPKGIVHTQAGYLLYAALTHKVPGQSDLWEKETCCINIVTVIVEEGVKSAVLPALGAILMELERISNSSSSYI